MRLGFGLGLTNLRASGGGAGPIPAPFQSVNADGWSVTYASPVVAAPEEFTVSRAGYVGTTPTTISENLFCTTRVRQVYPNQASLSADRVALSDYIYSTDTIPLVTNNSAEASPKPVANWALPDRTVIGNTLTAEVVAFHRNARAGEQVAAVEFIATDGSTTVSQVVTASIISGRTNDRFPVIVYRCNLDVSTLANPATITLNAKVYPHIGDASSVLDSSASSVAREFSPRSYRRDTTLAAAPVYAYVNASTGNDTTGAVNTNAATAEASPCLTIAGAINRIHAIAAEQGGAIIRLMAGTHVFSTSAIVATRTQTAAELIITRDPNTTRAAAIMQFGASAASRPRLGASGGWLRFSDITISRQGTFTIAGEAASALRIIFADCVFNNNSHNAAIYSNSDAIWMGTDIQNSATSLIGAAAREHRMWRGVSVSCGSQSLEGWLVLGCDITSPGALARGSRTASGSVVAFCRFVSPASATPLTDYAASEAVSGLAFCQNVIEYTSATPAYALRVSGDSATGNTTHIVVHHNTFAGFFTNGRGNLFYDDGATARTNKLMSSRGNIHVAINTKGDVFVTNGARVGNWAYLYGAGCDGEFSQFIDANSGGLGSAFAQAYPGMNASIGTSNSVRNDPLFVDYEGTTSGPTAGAGGGDYAIQSGSPAKGIVKPVLAFDIAGNARSPTLASAGAYE